MVKWAAAHLDKLDELVDRYVQAGPYRRVVAQECPLRSDGGLGFTLLGTPGTGLPC